MIRDRRNRKKDYTRTENPCVVGSIPTRATHKLNNIKTWENYKSSFESFFVIWSNYNQLQFQSYNVSSPRQTTIMTTKGVKK